METEVVSFIKGDYKTVIICKFNKDGSIISHSFMCEDISKTSYIMRILKEDLLLAIEINDQEKISDLQSKINKLRELEESKPTF